MTNPQEWTGRPSFLLAAIGAFTQIKFTEAVAGVGLAPHHVGVLRQLDRRQGSSQQEVADALRVRRNLMVGLVDDLEAKGLVERRRHPVDRRANALHVTAAGRRVLARTTRIADALDEELFHDLPAGAREPFLATLRQLGVSTGVADGVFPTFDDGTPVLNSDQRTSNPARSA